MKTKAFTHVFDPKISNQKELAVIENGTDSGISIQTSKQNINGHNTTDLAEILLISSYPPRECGLATYSQDLIKSINNKFSDSLSIKVCALESGHTNYSYPEEVKYTLNTSSSAGYEKLAFKINNDKQIKIVLIQHEFGLYKAQEQSFLQFLYELSKPVVIVFHTVIPQPDDVLKAKVQNIASACESIVVMTHHSADILKNDYAVPQPKISVIAHGTHLVLHLNKKFLKLKYGLKDRKVLSTFGLLSSGKGIETTIDALPAIVKQYPEVVFLIIGKTHPEVKKNEGEKYRESLLQKVQQYDLQDHVIFINHYLALPDLLEYLQLTDIYLFTSNDPNQAVSGTFAYAMSCACPIISTPIPHAKEVLTKDTGIIIDFRNSQQLADGVIRLLSNDTLRRNMSSNALQKIVSTAWENSSVDHVMLLEKIARNKINVRYNLPTLNLNHLKKMTTHTGIIQFSKTNQPDICSGYTLDDNARALIASCMYFKLTGDEKSLNYINTYLNFIKLCQQPSGDFLNYLDKENNFTSQNTTSNLDDANGRAVWALGFLVSIEGLLPEGIIAEAEIIIKKAIPRLETIHSTRAMAFVIKGLYFHYQSIKFPENLILIKTLANRLVPNV